MKDNMNIENNAQNNAEDHVGIQDTSMDQVAGGQINPSEFVKRLSPVDKDEGKSGDTNVGNLWNNGYRYKYAE